jgi:hypothetical protein
MTWKFSDAKDLTLKEYLYIYDSFCLSSWDHTAQLSCLIHGLTSVVANALSSKGKVKPRGPEVFNPYRVVDVPKDNRITAANFKILKYVGHSMVQGR